MKKDNFEITIPLAFLNEINLKFKSQFNYNEYSYLKDYNYIVFDEKFDLKKFNIEKFLKDTIFVYEKIYLNQYNKYEMFDYDENFKFVEDYCSNFEYIVERLDLKNINNIIDEIKITKLIKDEKYEEINKIENK
jgi:hypothetical protein